MPRSKNQEDIQMSDNLGHREPAYIILHQYPDACLEAKWRDCLARAECPAHYDAPDFFLEPQWENKRVFAILAFENDKVGGVLTGIHNGRETQSGLMSRPQVCLAKNTDSNSVVDALAAGLLKESEADEMITVYAWEDASLDRLCKYGYRRKILEGNAVIDLSVESTEKILARVDRDRRRQVRLAIKNGVEVREAETEGDIEACFEVYEEWKKTERKEIQHDHTLELWKKILGPDKNYKRFAAIHEGKVVATSGVRFYPGGLVECANNSSLDKYLRLYPNNLLIWKTIEWACANRFQRVSLGGAHPFLRHWGGVVLPICRYRLDRTVLRHHDRREDFLEKVRAMAHALPDPAQEFLSKVKVAIKKWKHR
jgi:Acetyltransferase (GNAT) domain